MKISLHRIIILSICFTISQFSYSFGNIECKQIKFYNDLTTEKDVFLEAFNTAYGKLTLEQLFGTKYKWKDVNEFLDAVWNEVELKLRSSRPDFYLVSAKENKNQVVGLIAFEKTKGNEVYVKHLAVHPQYQQKGIMTQLAYSMKDLTPNMKKVSFVTRKTNEPLIKIVKNLGFKETNFQGEDWNPEFFQKYELDEEGIKKLIQIAK